MGRDSERDMRRHNHVFRVLLSTTGTDRCDSERKRFQAIESRVHSDGLAVFHQRASDGGPLLYPGPPI